MAEVLFGPWRSSSYSLNEGNCVELAVGPVRIGVRDSKNRDGGKLVLDAAAFQGLLAAVKERSAR